MKIFAKKNRRGFTLIEIMVAIFILALVLTSIYSTWMAILHGSKTGLETAAAAQRSRMAMRTLEDSLNCVRSFAADIDYYAFYADETSLSFVSKLPESFPRSGKFGDFDVRRVTFSIEAGPNSSQQLVLRQNPILMDMDEDEKKLPVVLAKNVKKFEVAFWDTKSADWIAEWTQTNQLPLMVMVTLQLGGNNSQSSQIAETVSRVIGLPSIMVQTGWQAPGIQGGPGGGNRQGGSPQPGVPQPGGPQPVPIPGQPGIIPKP
jgi:type II secretion system protein J